MLRIPLARKRALQRTLLNCFNRLRARHAMHLASEARLVHCSLSRLYYIKHRWARTRQAGEEALAMSTWQAQTHALFSSYY